MSKILRRFVKVLPGLVIVLVPICSPLSAAGYSFRPPPGTPFGMSRVRISIDPMVHVDRMARAELLQSLKDLGFISDGNGRLFQHSYGNVQIEGLIETSRVDTIEKVKGVLHSYEVRMFRLKIPDAVPTTGADSNDGGNKAKPLCDKTSKGVSLADARQQKARAVEIFARVGEVAGVGIVRMKSGYGLKVNLREAPHAGASLPRYIDGVPTCVEILGPVRKR